MSEQMYHPFIIGERIYFRALERADLEGNYFQWLNDYEVTKYLESGIFPNSTEAMESYFNKIDQSPNDVFFAVIERETGLHIGNIKIGSINWVKRTADIGTMIGERKAWGKGYGTEALKLATDYCFKRLNLQKITVGVIPENLAAKRYIENLGFSHEGTIRRGAYINGKYCDALIYGQLVEEWKF